MCVCRMNRINTQSLRGKERQRTYKKSHVIFITSPHVLDSKVGYTKKAKRKRLNVSPARLNFLISVLSLFWGRKQEEESGSSTDMSVCRSEPLFSSMRDSEMQSELNNPVKDHRVVDGGAAAIANLPRNVGQDSLIQDSLTDEDFNFGEKVTVNKNNYTLTFSGQGVISSFIASMVSSTGANLEPPGTVLLLAMATHSFLWDNSFKELLSRECKQK